MKTNFTLLLLFLLLCSALWIFAGTVKEEHKASPTTLVAKLVPTKGFNTFGLVKIQAIKEGVKITADVENLTPGPHGFHIHRYGDLSDATGKKVGGHLGSSSKKEAHEGSEGSEGSHQRTRPDGRPIGDMQMLNAGKDGKAHMEMIIHGLSASELIGRSILVHAHEDRMENGKMVSGSKIAMAVIGIAKPE